MSFWIEGKRIVRISSKNCSIHIIGSKSFHVAFVYHISYSTIQILSWNILILLKHVLNLELIMIDNKFHVFPLKGYKVILFFDGNRDFVPMVHTLVAEHILAFFNTAEGSP